MPAVIRRALIGPLAFLLAACATQYAPYQTSNGGYSEIQISPEIYLIRVKRSPWNLSENRVLPRERDLAVLRSAELALEKGSRFFIIDGGECRVPYFRGFSVTCKIKLFRERPNIANPTVLVYRAVEVQRELRSKLGLEPMS